MVNNLNIQPSAVEEKVDPIAAAFAALKKFDWGQDTGAIKTLDEAVVKAADDKAKKALSAQFCQVLDGEASYAAKDYACRQLSLVGGDECVKSLAKLLPSEKTCHGARYALERFGSSSAIQALGKALKEAGKGVRLSLVNSLKNIDSNEAHKVLAHAAVSFVDSDAEASEAATLALCHFEDGQSLAQAYIDKKISEDPINFADAVLRNSEVLLAKGKEKEAKKLLRMIKKGEFSENAKQAATSKLKALKKK